jgi:Xaa-Pro aminopeptidase
VNIPVRLERLRRQLAQNNVEALWVSQPDNLYYLSGCEGLEGYLLITDQDAVLVTDFRYVEQAQRQSPAYRLFRIMGKMAGWLPELLATVNIRTLGFESGHLSFSAYRQLEQILQHVSGPVVLLETANLVESLRAVKDPDEISSIRQAASITDAVFNHVERVLRPGLSELALAWEIEKFMRENGSQPVPFELIVAAGPNSALPHARPTGYLIRNGDPVVIDIGSKFAYYGSDLTRTVCCGKPDETFRQVYRTVLAAQLAAIADIRPGMTGVEADAIARDIIRQAGFGDSFGHSLGHGIGLVTHEKPTVGPNSADVLGEGMVFTIEPGIYLSGWGGVRIEDDVVLAGGRLQVLSSAPKMTV